MAKEQTALAATMMSLRAELAAERSGVATPATPSSPRRRYAAVALGVEAQHALRMLHVSDKITAESLASGGVESVKQGSKDCGMCAASKMRASAVRQNGGPRPVTGAAAHACEEVGSSGEAAGLDGAVSSEWRCPGDSRGGVPNLLETREDSNGVRRGGVGVKKAGHLRRWTVLDD